MQMISHVRVKCHITIIVWYLSKARHKNTPVLSLQKWAVHSEVAACVIDETDSEEAERKIGHYTMSQLIIVHFSTYEFMFLVSR